MEKIKNIIKSLGIIVFISLIVDLIRNCKKSFHIHKWEFGYESVKLIPVSKEVKFTSRFCPRCGKKQLKFINGTWRDWKMTKEEMRDFKLNQIL
jgi:hypothetical protein